MRSGSISHTVCSSRKQAVTLQHRHVIESHQLDKSRQRVRESLQPCKNHREGKKSENCRHDQGKVDVKPGKGAAESEAMKLYQHS